MKLLKISALTATVAGLVALAVIVGPSVSAQGRGRELTILGGRGGELGVSISDGKAGVEIDDVHADSAAEKAGLKRGDVILEFDGEHVRSSRQFTRLVQETPSGKSVKATIARDGKKQDVQVTLAEGRESRVILGGPDGRFFDGDVLRGFSEQMPKIERDFRDNMREFRGNMPNFNYRFDGPGGLGIMSGGRLGVTVDELTSQLATYFGAKDGVLVTSVTDGSAAQKAGIKAGDVITSINGDRVNSSSDLIASLRRVENDEVAIGIVRDKKEQTVKAKLDAPRRTIRGARPA